MQKQADTLSPENIAMIRNYLLMGAKIGLGGAAVTSAFNYLNHLRRKNDSSKDDDTLYVYKDMKPGQVKKADAGEFLDWPTGISLTGGLLTAIGTYAAGRKLYHMLRKRQAQAELDNAQKAFVETQGYKTMKKKADAPVAEVQPSSPGAANIVTGGLTFTLPALMMLAAAGGAWKFLDKTFPLQKKKVKGPRRIEIMENPALAEPENEEMAKLAAFEDSLEESDACEFLVRVLLTEKKANSSVAELVHSVAKEGPYPFMSSVEQIGFLDSLDLVKGASATPAHPFKEHIATCLLTKSARVGDMVGLIAAGEFAENHPDAMRAVSYMDDETREAMFKLACIIGQACRAEVSEEFGIQSDSKDLEKAAFTDAAFELLADQVANINSDDMPSNAAETAENGTAQKRRKAKFILNGKSARRVMDGLPDKDIIDRLLDPEPYEDGEPSQGQDS